MKPNMNKTEVSSVFRAGWKRLASVALAAAALVTTPVRAADTFTVGTLAGGGVSLNTLNGNGTAARFLNPTSTAVDASGNLYVADGGDHTIRKITPTGDVTTFAGSSGEAGSVDGTGGAARFVYPFGVAVGGDGNIYVTDIGDHTVRKITPAGVVTTLAGTAGVTGSANGVGAAAQFYLPQGIAVGPGSNYYVYVADNGNSTIRRIDSSGNVITFAGAAGVTGHVNGLPGVARFNYPVGVTVDTVGNVFVADFGNNAIRKLDTGGTTTTLAGDLLGTGGHVDGTGVFARFRNPSGVAVNPLTGDVFVADTSNHVIRKINTSSIVTTISGSPGTLGSADGTSAARFFYPAGISVSANGTKILVVDTGSHSIRSLDNTVSPVNTTTFAGATGAVGTTDGAGAAARFTYPYGVAVDGSGNVYVADHDAHTVRKISPAGVTTTIAGTAGVSGSADGTGTAATFKGPTGIAVDGSGNVYVADTDNDTVRKITAAGEVSTFVATSAGLDEPRGLAVDGSGNVYVANTLRHTIHKVTPAGVVSTYAGTDGASGSADGDAATARFNRPYSIAVDASGVLFVGDFGNHTVRKIATDGTVTTIAGTAEVSGKVDGDGAAARFNRINSIAVNSAGTIYVTDTFNRAIRVINGTTVSSLSGARFYYPQGIAVDAIGNLYIADGDNQQITKASLVLDPPVGGSSVGNKTIQVGANTTFTIGSPVLGMNYQWEVSTDAGSTWTDITNDATYSGATTTSLTVTAATLGLSGHQYRVKLSNSSGNATSATGTLTVNPAAPGGGNPVANQTVIVGQNAAFTVGSPDVGVTYVWQVSTDGGTSWTALTEAAPYSGTTTATLSITSTTAALNGHQYRVQMTNISGTSPSAAGTLTVNPTAPGDGGAVGNQTIKVGESAVFNLATTEIGLSYQWQVSTNGGTSWTNVANNATYSGATTTTLTISNATEALNGNQYRVQKTNISGTSASDSGTLTVNPTAPAGGGSVANQTVQEGENAAFAGGTTVIGTSYQWEVSTDGGTTWTAITNNATYSGATTTTLTVANASIALNGNLYRLKLTNISGSNVTASASLTVTVLPAPTTARLINLSVRTQVGTGANAVFVGLGITGSGSKQVVIRGAGPALTAFNVPGVLAAPTLTLFDNNNNNALITSNTGWSTAPNSGSMATTFNNVGAFPFAANSADSAIVQSLATGTYSAQIAGVNGTTGIALAEFYDGDGSSFTTRFTNASARAQVGTGAGVLTAGFVVSGQGTVKVLVRGVGPGLVPFGITSGFLATPQIRVLNKAGTEIAANAGWSGSAEMSETFTKVGAFPYTTGSIDTALVLELEAGDYTVQLSGANNTTGIGLIEVYEIR